MLCYIIVSVVHEPSHKWKEWGEAQNISAFKQYIAPLVKACSGEGENSNPSFLKKEITSSFPSL